MLLNRRPLIRLPALCGHRVLHQVQSDVADQVVRDLEDYGFVDRVHEGGEFLVCLLGGQGLVGL